MLKQAHFVIGLASVLMSISVVALAQVAPTEDPSPWIREIGVPQYFAVSVENVDKSLTWYIEVFGLRKLDDNQAEDGRWRIANLVNDHLFVEVIRDARDQLVERARGIAKVGFRVADVRTVADRVEAATGERPRVLSFEQHGIRLVQLRDPDGNIIQLSSPLER